ncbi:MAG TPA: PLP-dependent aminotransferase family protein [Minicystis sp.]|nr:PLP-dependent aminotransferase family protein [Minicystis sp.]
MTTTTPHAAPAPIRLARRMSRMPPSAVREILKVAEQPDVLSFAGGLPAPEFFPVDEISAAHAEVLASEGKAALQYSTTEGFGPLREWIRARLARRGVRAATDQILITNGSQQGIDLIGRVLLDPGDVVAVESPSYLAALQSFAGCEASFVSIASDDGGMQVDAFERAVAERSVKLVYLVPEFQNPKGTTLARERRARLLRVAQAHRIVVLEDDPYSELRVRGEAPPPLAALDDAGLVVQLGTFSKTLAPGMRLAWLTGPREIVRAATSAKQAADLHTATLAQRAAARLLAHFDYDGHLARIRRAYGERCAAMLDALARHMPPGTRWTRPDGGLFVWVELPFGLSADEIFADALREKVAFVPGSGFFADAPRREFMRLNYSNRPPELIEEGMARLGRVVRQRLASA